MIEKKQNHILILHTKPQWKMPGYTNNSYFWTKKHVLVPPYLEEGQGPYYVQEDDYKQEYQHDHTKSMNRSSNET